jgi:riboflavin synthase
MFTGIIEATGTIRQTLEEAGNRDFWIESALTPELKIDQSVAHNGVCLTVVAINDLQYRVTAVAETLAKTTLAAWQAGDTLNLERSLRVGDRLDGHFVQGHVDAVAECTGREEAAGSWLFRFRFPAAFAPLLVEKGSVCIDGVSLTAFDVGETSFTVTIIPYTYEHTGFRNIVAGAAVNIEFDVLGKYFLRQQSLNGGPKNPAL